jgi:hypothetical protein
MNRRGPSTTSVRAPEPALRAQTKPIRAVRQPLEKDMLKKTIAGTFVLAAALTGAHAPAVAAEAMQDDWAVMMSSKGMDKNHDGMVSKKEFLDMMAKAYDMKAREMKSGKSGMTQAQLNDFVKSLYTGG